MQTRPIVILGSTGSIGRSTLDVIRCHPNQFEVRALAAYSNVELLVAQYREFRPQYLCLVDETRREELTTALAGEAVEISAGEQALIALAGLRGAALVVNAVVGAAGLRASLATVEAGIDLALANKESLVTGGPLFPSLLRKTGAQILPIDSEHSAIWQVLQCGKREEVRKIILTASGGPFRNLSADQFAAITVEQALAHPTWKMGAKITIDSATLANKGLEVIEAVQLFEVPADSIEVVVHPQSIIHSLVEYRDSAVIGQLSMPDMRLPITYALFWPERPESDFGVIDWSKLGTLTFEKPDLTRFPALGLAFEVARLGGTMPAVFNAANEIAVAAFLERKIRFTEIAEIIRRTLDQASPVQKPSLDDILDADRGAREIARRSMELISL
jgi:1-deoxy-D-xylulose-5-phosphate reductoisomerase